MLAGLLEEAVRRNPDRPALEEPAGRSLSYRELDAAATRIAGELRAAGVARGDRVGVCLPKSPEAIAAILGVLKASAAYVPIDARAPVERSRHILEDCAARTVCTDDGGAARLGLGDSALRVSCEAAPAGSLAMAASAATLESAGGDDLAYILYTSGSTGRPKGVMHTHSSALSFVDWAHDFVDVREGERFSSHAPLHFDLSIFDLFVCLKARGTLVLIDEGAAAQPRQLAAIIEEQRIAIWYSVPSILALMARHGRLAEHPCAALRVVAFAGEVFPVAQLRHLQSLWPDKTYFNFYGPTETNVCTAYRLPGPVADARTTPVPIGRACANVRARVLDERGAPVEAGEEGLLHVHASGPTMRGYWGGAGAASAEAFSIDPAGERWYCTGDVVREDADGHYLFCGRRDRMVKRRGYRIELAEVEAGLHRHPEIAEAAAVSLADGDAGVEIVAFVVHREEAGAFSPIALKRFCVDALPAYMCPDRFEALPALPRTSTDKVDLRELAQLARKKSPPRP